MQKNADDSICTQSKSEEHKANCVQCVGGHKFKTCPDVRHLLITFGLLSGSWIPWDETEERPGCLHSVCILRKHVFVGFPTDFRKPITKTAYQTFPVVSDSTKEPVAGIWGEPERAPH